MNPLSPPYQTRTRTTRAAQSPPSQQQDNRNNQKHTMVHPHFSVEQQDDDYDKIPSSFRDLGVSCSNFASPFDDIGFMSAPANPTGLGGGDVHQDNDEDQADAMLGIVPQKKNKHRASTSRSSASAHHRLDAQFSIRKGLGTLLKKQKDQDDEDVVAFGPLNDASDYYDSDLDYDADRAVMTIGANNEHQQQHQQTKKGGGATTTPCSLGDFLQQTSTHHRQLSQGDTSVKSKGSWNPLKQLKKAKKAKSKKNSKPSRNNSTTSDETPFGDYSVNNDDDMVSAGGGGGSSTHSRKSSSNNVLTKLATRQERKQAKKLLQEQTHQRQLDQIQALTLQTARLQRQLDEQAIQLQQAQRLAAWKEIGELSIVTTELCFFKQRHQEGAHKIAALLELVEDLRATVAKKERHVEQLESEIARQDKRLEALELQQQHGGLPLEDTASLTGDSGHLSTTSSRYGGGGSRRYGGSSHHSSSMARGNNNNNNSSHHASFASNSTHTLQSLPPRPEDDDCSFADEDSDAHLNMMTHQTMTPAHAHMLSAIETSNKSLDINTTGSCITNSTFEGSSSNSFSTQGSFLSVTTNGTTNGNNNNLLAKHLQANAPPEATEQELEDIEEEQSKDISEFTKRSGGNSTSHQSQSGGKSPNKAAVTKDLSPTLAVAQEADEEDLMMNHPEVPTATSFTVDIEGLSEALLEPPAPRSASNTPRRMLKKQHSGSSRKHRSSSRSGGSSRSNSLSSSKHRRRGTTSTEEESQPIAPPASLRRSASMGGVHLNNNSNSSHHRRMGGVKRSNSAGRGRMAAASLLLSSNGSNNNSTHSTTRRAKPKRTASSNELDKDSSHSVQRKALVLSRLEDLAGSPKSKKNNDEKEKAHQQLATSYGSGSSLASMRRGKRSSLTTPCA